MKNNHVQLIPEQLRQLLFTYSEQDEYTVLSLLIHLQLPFSKHAQFNQQLNSLLQLTYMNLIQSHNSEDFQSLVNLLFTAREKCRHIKNWIILTLIDNILQTLDQRVINKIVNTLLSGYCKMGKLETQDVFKLHKIINQCLRIMNSPQDAIIRGQLQCIMTKILKFGHQSGLRKKQPRLIHQKRSIESQDYDLHFKNSPQESRAYIAYWKLCNRLEINPNPNLFANDDYSYDSQLSLHNFEANLKIMISYFRNKPSTDQHKDQLEQCDLNLSAIPHYFLKYSTKQQFRTLLMLRIIIYCRDFRYILAKNSQPPNRYCQKSQQAEEVISNVQSMAFLFIEQSQSAKNRIQIMLMNFYKKEEIWRESQQKRGFQDLSYTKKLQQAQIDANQSLIMEPVQPKNSVYNLRKLQQSCHEKKLAMLQTRAQPSYLLLNTRQLPILSNKPTIPSFSYYSSSAVSYLNSYSNCETQQLEGDQQYDMLQWKAMRNLCRQNIGALQLLSDGTSVNNNSCKLIQFVKRNQQLFTAPRKRVKLMQETDVE